MNPRTQIFVKARTSDRKFSLKRKYFTCVPRTAKKNPHGVRTPEGKFSSKGVPRTANFRQRAKSPHGVRTSRARARPLKQRNQPRRLPRHDPRLKPPGSGLHLTAKLQALGSWAFSCLDARKGEEHHRRPRRPSLCCSSALSPANMMLGQLVVQDACVGPESLRS